jgi:hypothetical protein
MMAGIAVSDLSAEDRKYVVGTTLNMTAGGSNGTNTGGASGDASVSGSSFEDVYPSVRMTSTGLHSILDLEYAFGFSRVNDGSGNSSDSHALSLTYSGPIRRRWKITVSDSFQSTSNTTAFYGSRGVISPQENFVFNPLGATSTQTIRSSVGVEYGLDERSSLSFSGSYSYLNYSQQDPAFRGLLTRQQGATESVTFSHKFSRRSGWTVSYNGAYTDYMGQFDNTVTHAASVGVFTSIGRDVTFQLTGGPSYVQAGASSGNYASYNASASIGKPIKSNTLSVSYAHTSGQSTGVGSLSNSDHAGFGLSRKIGKRGSLFTDVSAFDTRSSLGAAYSTRGVAASASVGISVSRKWSVQVGGQYQRYDQTSVFGSEQKRVYAGLRFEAPQLWSGVR